MSDTLRPLTVLGTRALALAKNNKVLQEDREAARAIGQIAHDIGGIEMMREVYHIVQFAWSHGAIGALTENDFHPAEFNFVWDGIGDWRS